MFIEITSGSKKELINTDIIEFIVDDKGFAVLYLKPESSRATTTIKTGNMYADIKILLVK